MKDLLELNVWVHKFEIILEKAFYKIYAPTEKNWIRLDSINIFTECRERLSEAPLLELHFTFGHFDEQYECVALYEIEESEEYNCGVLKAVMEKTFEYKGSN